MPTFAYQVSGEYAMIEAAARERLDRRRARDDGEPPRLQARRRRRHPHLFRAKGGGEAPPRAEAGCSAPRDFSTRKLRHEADRTSVEGETHEDEFAIAGVHRRHAAAGLGRPLLHLREADDRRRHHRHRRVLRRHLRPESHDGDDRGHVRPLRRGHGPVPHRGAVAQGLRVRLHAAARCFADGRPLRHRDRALGHHRQGDRQAGLRSARRARAREAPLLHLHLSRYGRGPGQLDLLERRAVGRARGALCEPGFHGHKIRSRSALLRVRSAPALARVARSLRKILPAACARPSAARPISSSARTGSSPPPAPSAWRSASSPTIPCGSRSRRRRKSRRRWRWWRAAPRFPSRPASA